MPARIEHDDNFSKSQPELSKALAQAFSQSVYTDKKGALVDMMLFVESCEALGLEISLKQKTNSLEMQ